MESLTGYPTCEVPARRAVRDAGRPPKRVWVEVLGE